MKVMPKTAPPLDPGDGADSFAISLLLPEVRGGRPFITRSLGRRLLVIVVRCNLPLDELALFASEPRVLTLPHLLQGFLEVAQDVEFVEQDLGLRGMGSVEGRSAKRFPHIQHCQANALACLGPQPRIEQIHTRFSALHPPEPDGPSACQIADPNAVGVSLANGNLVHAQQLGPRCPGPAQLLPHVVFVQLLDRPPVQVQLPCDGLERRGAAPAADEEGKALGVKGIVGSPGQFLLFHRAAVVTPHTPPLDFQVDPGIATRQIAHPAPLVVVEGPLPVPTDPTACFFPCRRRRRTRALGSPTMPWTGDRGRKPGNRYVSANRRDGCIVHSCHVFSQRKTQHSLAQRHVPALRQDLYPLEMQKTQIPKGNGQLRPRGLPAVEDKLLQGAATRLLEAISEQDFLRWSDGYRPGRGALLLGVGILHGKRHLDCPSQCVFLSSVRPGFRVKAAQREAMLIAQCHQKSNPSPAKHTHQVQLGGPPRSGGRELVGRQWQERAFGNPLLGYPADAEQPQGGHGDGQPQSRGSLRICHASALPLPPAPFGDLEALLNPRPQPIPTGLASAGR